jgi:hypothetical protein
MYIQQTEAKVNFESCEMEGCRSCCVLTDSSDDEADVRTVSLALHALMNHCQSGVACSDEQNIHVIPHKHLDIVKFQIPNFQISQGSM